MKSSVSVAQDAHIAYSAMESVIHSVELSPVNSMMVIVKYPGGVNQKKKRQYSQRNLYRTTPLGLIVESMVSAP